MNRRDAVTQDLRALAEDLKSLYESATTDPKARQWKERRWAALEGTIGVLTTLVARRLVVKLWGILTGEEAPKRPPTERVRRPEHHEEAMAETPPAVTMGEHPTAVTMAEPPTAATTTDPWTQAMSQPDAETMSSSSSSVK